MATNRAYASEYGEWTVTTDDTGTYISVNDNYILRTDILPDDDYSVGNNSEVIAYASEKIGVDIEEAHDLCVVSDLTSNDPIEVIEAIHYALYKINNRSIEKWIAENYVLDDWEAI
jgi:hypothetical protein